MLRLGRFAAAAVFTAAASGCATMDVGSHVERGLDFSPYRTYDWGPAGPLPTGDPRLDRNPFFQDHMMGAVEKQLAARGLVRANGTSDVLIHYHAAITNRIDVDRLDRQSGYCYGQDCSVSTFEYEEGTIVLDLVDARTNRVIWRGWAQHRMQGVLDDPDLMAERIDEAVTRMLQQLPAAF